MMSKGTFMKDEELNATGSGVVAFRWTKHTVHVINMYIVNKHCTFFKRLLLCNWAYRRQNKCMVRIYTEVSTKVVKIRAPDVG